MIKKFGSMMSEAKYTLDLVVNEHQERSKIKQETKIERQQLLDLVANKGSIRDDHQSRLQKYIGRIYLVGVVDIEEESKAYRQAAENASNFLEAKDFENYEAASEHVSVLHDIMTAKASDTVRQTAEKIVGSRDEDVNTFLASIAVSNGNFQKKKESFNTTRLAMQKALDTDNTSGSLGNVMTSHLKFNDNHMYDIMQVMSGNVRTDAGRNHLATVAIVDPTEPRNPFIPTEYQRDLTKELRDGGAVVLSPSPHYRGMPRFIPVK